MTKYEVIIYWSAEDDAFVAKVPELPGVQPMVRHDKKRWRMLTSSFRSGLKQPKS